MTQNSSDIEINWEFWRNGWFTIFIWTCYQVILKSQTADMLIFIWQEIDMVHTGTVLTI